VPRRLNSEVKSVFVGGHFNNLKSYSLSVRIS